MSKCEFNMVAHSSVLSHKKLSNAAKLLYVWICSKRVDEEYKTISWGENDQDVGYCQKSNKFFSEKMGKGETYISQLITELEEAGFLYIKRKNIGGRNYRRMWVTPDRITQEPPSAIGKSADTTLGYNSNRLRPGLKVSSPIAEDHIKEDYQEYYQEDVVSVPTDSNSQVESELKSDGYILAKALLEMIRRNKKFYSRIARYVSPEKEENTLRGWAKEIDLLLTRDAVPYDEAVRVLKWCHKDEFWQGQILSGGKFRKQFETLKNQMDGGSSGRFGQPDDHPEITEKIIEAYRWLINNSKWKPAHYQVPKFIEAAERVIAFIDIHNDRDLSTDELIGYLKNCLQEHYREKGDMVHPGNMNSGYTWDVLLPQYLENVIGAL